MSSKLLIMSPGLKHGKGHSSNLISKQCRKTRLTTVRPPDKTCLICHIMVNPTKHGSVIILGTPIDIQRVHSRKAKDNSTTSTVLGSLPVTTVWDSTWSRTASSLQRKSLGTNKRTQTWPSITRIKSKMLYGEETLLSMRHHSPECQ